MINGVLVEKTVKDVTPALQTNLEGLKKVLEELVKQYKRQQDDMEKWKVSFLSFEYYGHNQEKSYRTRLELSNTALNHGPTMWAFTDMYFVCHRRKTTSKSCNNKLYPISELEPYHVRLRHSTSIPQTRHLSIHATWQSHRNRSMVEGERTI